MPTVVWEGVEAASRERCQVVSGPERVSVQSVIDADTGRCCYTLQATADWHFASVVVRIGERELDVRRSDQGWEVSGELRPDLAEAREVDISVSPLSNTLPIRRLRLAVGESADIVTAYIRVPELDVAADPQRYTRTSGNENLYESRDSSFRRSIRVDDDGLVIDYPGLFVRGGSDG